MVGDPPEGAFARALNVNPEMFMPERLGAGQQGVFQHINGRSELLPQSGADYRVRQLFSHNRCSFPLVFSPCLAMLSLKAVRICPISTVSCSRVLFFAQFERAAS